MTDGGQECGGGAAFAIESRRHVVQCLYSLRYEEVCLAIAK